MEPHEKTELRVEVTLYQPASGGSGMRFSETLNIGATDFEALAAILKRFHDLFQEIKKQEARSR